MVIENWIDKCRGNVSRQRDVNLIRGIAIHRIGSELGKNAEEIARELDQIPSVGGMAYTFVIDESGTIQQACELSDITPHARAWNTSMIGIACIGDFRKHAPTLSQWRAAVQLCALVAPLLHHTVRDQIRGHDELPGGSSDPQKKCPGALWDMNRFRREVAEQISSSARRVLSGSGIVV